jgi:hypothetical protein
VVDRGTQTLDRRHVLESTRNKANEVAGGKLNHDESGPHEEEVQAIVVVIQPCQNEQMLIMQTSNRPAIQYATTVKAKVSRSKKGRSVSNSDMKYARPS